MKKVLLILNHNKVGGAERSAIEQYQTLKERLDFDVLIPNLEQSEENFGTFLNPKSFYLPKAYSDLSRSSNNNYFLSIFFFVWGVAVNTVKISFRDVDIIWINGLKSFVLLLPSVLIRARKKKIIISVRDYWPKHFSINFLLAFVRPLCPDIVFMCNSQSVEKDLIFKYPELKSKTHLVYNPCRAYSLNVNNTFENVNIGVSSMLTPWKGIHSVITFAKIFEQSLKDLGVERILIYGDAIYNTKGDHVHYKEQVYNLKKKLGANLIEFKGIKSSTEIFSTIDILIHPSLQKEPFGRVIVEAYANNIYLRSTGLGGSEEITLRESRFQANDYFDLFKRVKHFLENKDFQKDILSKQEKIYKEISLQATRSLEMLLLRE